MCYTYVTQIKGRTDQVEKLTCAVVNTDTVMTGHWRTRTPCIRVKVGQILPKLVSWETLQPSLQYTVMCILHCKGKVVSVLN